MDPGVLSPAVRRTVLILAVGAFFLAALIAKTSFDPALGGKPPEASVVTAVGADGRQVPAVDTGDAKAFEAAMRVILPGYKFDPVASFENAPDGANYTELVGTAKTLGRVTATIYRYFDERELRSAGLTETNQPGVGTFWIGALDLDLTSVYFLPENGPAVWLGIQSTSVSGPATPLAVVKPLAIAVSAASAVRAMGAAL
ncbi:MAG: hypothetical protein ACT4OM_09410 [Actinomycetota bacterium]